MIDLKKVLEDKKEEYISYLKDLIAIDTQDIGHGILGGREKEGQDYLIALLKRMGAQIKIDPMNEEVIQGFYSEHGEGNLNHNYDDRYNVYAKFQGTNIDKSIMFNGHMDVMPPGDESEWTTPPFSPEIRQGQLYGRGSADMKSGLVAAVMAVKLLQDAGIALPVNVLISSVCDEEGGGNGSMQAISNGEKAGAVVVCEGTDRELIVAHMGFVFFRVTFEGKACHSGTKKDGVSAIEKAFKVISALNEKEHQWLLEYKHPLLPPPNLNVGVIHGGTAGSTVAGDCYFETCVHYLPTLMSHEQVVSEFKEVVERVCQSDPWLEEHRPEITIYQSGHGYEMDVADPFVEQFQKAYHEATGRDVKIVGSPSGSDARLWRNVAKVPTLQYGPGKLSQAHAVDEHVDISDYLESILIYANLILVRGQA